MKTPPKQYTDNEAKLLTEKFIEKYKLKDKKSKKSKRKK
jgi:hypothetical protein